MIESLPAWIGPKVTKAHLKEAIILDKQSLNSLGGKNPASAAQPNPIVKEMRMFTAGHGIMVLTNAGNVKVVTFGNIDHYELFELPAAPKDYKPQLSAEETKKLLAAAVA